MPVFPDPRVQRYEHLFCLFLFVFLFFLWQRTTTKKKKLRKHAPFLTSHPRSRLSFFPVKLYALCYVSISSCQSRVYSTRARLGLREEGDTNGCGCGGKGEEREEERGGWFVVDLDDQLSREGRGSERMSKKKRGKKERAMMLA